MKYGRPAGAVSTAPLGWTADRVTLLRALWRDGLSASQIAARLGGVTRNAVIGKVHREQLPQRKTTNRVARKPRAQTRTKQEILGSFRASALNIRPTCGPRVPVSDAPTPLSTALLDLLDGHCRWPIGDPHEEGFAFCGHRAAAVSYCEHHARIAYQPPATRKR